MFKKIRSRFANFVSMATSPNLSKSALKQKCLLLLIITASVCIPMHKANAGALDIILDGILFIVYPIVYIVVFVLLQFAALFVKIGAYLVDVMLEQGIYSIIFDISSATNPLMTGWTIIRDFANTFFIFILLIIAFSTILRISKYSAKNLLPKFIIALFLINFSAVIALIVIDFGQVFMYEIVGWMGNGFGGNNGAMGNLTSIVDNEFLTTYKAYGHIGGGGYSLENTIGVSFALAFTVIMGCVYIMLAGFLLIRLTVLAILVVLSPVAFLGIIMPGLSSHAASWWRKLFEYSLFGPIFIFFVFLASQMANSLTVYSSPVSTVGLEGLSAFVGIVIPYCVAIAMLLAVIPITKQLGIAGTGALMGGALGVGKIAMGTYAGAKLAGGFGKKTGGVATRRSAKARSVRDAGRERYQKIMKKVPWGLGSQSAQQSKVKQNEARKESIDNRKKKYGGNSDALDIELLIKGDDIDKALAFQAAGERGELDGKHKEEFRDLMPAMERVMDQKTKDNLANRSLDLYTKTGENAKNIKDVDGNGIAASELSEKAEARVNAGTTNAEKQKLLEEEIKKKKFNEIKSSKDGRIEDIQDLESESTTQAIIQGLSGSELKAFIGKMTPDKKDNFNTGLKAATKDHQAISPDDQDSNMKTMLARIQISGDVKATLQDANLVDTRTGNISAAADPYIGTMVKKMDTTHFAKLTDDAIPYISERINASQAKNVSKAGYQEVFDAIKDNVETKQAGSAGTIKSPSVSPSDMDDLYDKLKRIV